MAIVKQLNTRIALKYDSYANWMMSPGKDLVLLKGEIGLCEISAAAQGSNVVPTVLFKVGDGNKTFENLPWASAKAADVYSWAKASEVKLENKKLVFVGGKPDGTNLEVPFDYCTIDEVKAITDSLAERLAVVEGKFTGDDSVQSQISALDERLDVIEGIDTVEGSVAKALKDAKAYTDAREVEIKKYADQAEADAISSTNSYTDGKVSKVAEDLAIEVEAREALAGRVQTLEAVDNATQAELNTYKGEVTNAIATAKSEAIGEAQSLVNGLASGQVATNAGNITQNTEDIARVEGLVSTNTSKINTLIGDDADKSVRAIAAEETAKIVAGADEDYDTLKEIAEFIMNDTTGAAGMSNAIAANTEAIGNLSTRMDGAEDAIAAVKEDVAKKLDESVFTDWKGSHEEGHAKSASDITAEINTAVNGEKALREAADTAINEKIGGNYSKSSTVAKAIADVKETADAAKTDLAALTGRVTTAEGNITAIQGIVSSGANSNASLRDAITTLQTLTGDATKGNEALYTEITRVAGLVDDSNTGLVATKAIADKNKTDIGTLRGAVAAIESDYLKAADEFILQCGTSTTVVHVKAN